MQPGTCGCPRTLKTAPAKCPRLVPGVTRWAQHRPGPGGHSPCQQLAMLAWGHLLAPCLWLFSCKYPVWTGCASVSGSARGEGAFSSCQVPAVSPRGAGRGTMSTLPTPRWHLRAPRCGYSTVREGRPLLPCLPRDLGNAFYELSLPARETPVCLFFHAVVAPV